MGADPDRPTYTVALDAETTEPDGPVLIRGFEVRRQTAQQPVQIVRDLAAQPPRTAFAAGAAFEVEDMNFDGFEDFRILDFAPAGPNVRYLHWLYRPEAGRFDPAPQLDALSSPNFDSELRQVNASERLSAAEYVDETYRFSGNELVLVRESVKKYSEPGSYQLRVRELVDGKMQVTDERRVDDP